ncbi:MAG: sodium:solute symporter family transporter [Pirellulaceae bacterium]
MPTQLTLTSLDFVVCAATLIGSMLIGLWLGMRKTTTGSSDGFFLAGRQLTWPVVGASLFATNIGAEHLVGLSGDSYRYGLKAGTVELGTAICIGIACWLLFPTYIRTKVFTIPEYLERRYDVRARLFFSGLMLLICVMTKMAFTLFAGALVVHSLFGWDVMSVAIFLSLAAAVVTILGGFAAVAYTDTIQTVIMIVGCTLMLFFGLDKVGGWDALVSKAGAQMHVAGPIDDPSYPFWGIIVGVLYGGVFYWGMDQVNVQRVLGARNLDQARWGAMFAALLKLTPIFIFALPGVITFALYPGITDEESKSTFVVMLNNLLPSGLRGLVLSALLAALISSILAVMNSVATMLVRDFFLYFKPDLRERVQVILGRAMVFVAAVAGAMAAYLVSQTQDGLYKYLQAISFYLCVPLVPAIFCAIVSRRINMTGAIWSVLVGSVISAIYVFDGIYPDIGRERLSFLHVTLTENYTFRGLWEVLITTVVLFVVSYATLPPPPEKVDGLTVDWSAPPEPFRGLTDWRLQLGALLTATVCLYAWLW